MKLWVSGEVEACIFEKYRLACNKVEETINDTIESKIYDVDIDSWDCIAIIRNDNEFEEITKYSIKKKDMDFRLIIDFESFEKSDLKGQQSLTFQMCLRSLEILKTKLNQVKDLDILIRDVTKIGLNQNWI